MVGLTPDPILRLWQQRLIDVALSEGKPNPLPVYGADGLGGSETQKAIFDYQTTHGLEMTGQFDPLTVAKLNTFRPAPDYSVGRALIPIILDMILKGGPNLNSIPSIAGWLNNSTILGLLRNVLISAGAWLTTSGLFTGAQWEQIVGTVIVVVSAILSFLANKKAADAKEIAKAVDAHPTLTVVPKSDGTATILSN